MSFHYHLADEFRVFRGESPDTQIPICLTGNSGSRLELYVSVVDQLGCAVNQLRLTSAPVARPNRDALKKQADAIASKVRYLLEPLQPLEFEHDAARVLLRSTPPSTTLTGTCYYELRQEYIGTAVRLTLERFLFQKSTDRSGRTPIPMQLTYEMLQKLINDLDAALPTA